MYRTGDENIFSTIVNDICKAATNMTPVGFIYYSTVHDTQSHKPYLFIWDWHKLSINTALNKKRNHLGKCDKHMGTLFSSKKYIQQIPSLQLQSYIHHVPKETKSFPNFTNNLVIWNCYTSYSLQLTIDQG